MAPPIQAMSLSEFAALQREFGTKIISRNGLFWRRVRPLFYRSVLPTQGLAEAEVSAPCKWPGAFQYVVWGEGRANSSMNFIILDNLREYSPANLGRRRCQTIQQAARRFQVRPLRDLQELKEHGFRAYRSFYQRTGYSYKSDRMKPSGFYAWAETLFRHRKTVLLGGYGPDGLAAVSCSYLVNRILVYATFFCETESLRKHLGELMFHELRKLAAQEPQVSEIFVRGYQGGSSLDHYYLLRGCKLIRKPARLEMPSLLGATLRWFMPQTHARLCGNV